METRRQTKTRTRRVAMITAMFVAAMSVKVGPSAIAQMPAPDSPGLPTSPPASYLPPPIAPYDPTFAPPPNYSAQGAPPPDSPTFGAASPGAPPAPDSPTFSAPPPGVPPADTAGNGVPVSKLPDTGTGANPP
jgi:hypothetical protein